jgi:NADPH oxidase
MVIMYTLAHEKIRKQCFEAFQRGHELFLVFLLAAWTHGSGCFVRNTVAPYDIFDGKEYWAPCVGYQSWRWETWSSVLYIVERIYAHWYVQRRANFSKVLQHPSSTLEIQFDRLNMDYKAGQWIFVKCPAVSRYEWHPFSISSCPYDPYISVHIRQMGDFTKALRNTFENMIDRPAYDIEDFDPHHRTTSILHARLQHWENPEIIVEGPYGSPAEDIFGSEVAILIGAGIGVTPWASVLKSLWHMRDPRFAKEGHRLRRVEFISTCKDLAMFEWFQNLISSLNAQSQGLENSDKSIRLYCHTYITRPTATPDSMHGSNMSSSSKPEARSDRQASLHDLLKRPNTLTRTKQQNYIHTGRPDFKTLFRDIRESLEIQPEANTTLRTRFHCRKQIAVNFCGPKGTARDIREACAESHTDVVRFRFKKESF